MPNTCHIATAIQECLPDQVRNVLISNLKRADLHDDAEVIANIETHFGGEIKRSDPYHGQVRGFFEWQKEFHQYLASFQNTLCYDENAFTETYNSEDPFIKELLQNMGSQYGLLEAKATGTSWSTDTNQRILLKETAYQLKDVETGSYITFLAPRPESFLHVLMVYVPLELQGNYMFLKRQFAGFFNALLHWNAIKGLESMCLKHTKHMPAVRGPEWRTRELEDGDTRLMRVWRHLGGVTLPDTDDDRLYFCRYEQALEFKEAVEADGFPSPYRYLYRSIYSKEQETRLKPSGL